MVLIIFSYFHDSCFFNNAQINENQYKMNISQGKNLVLELKILKILEITLSLRQRSSMMPASLRTLRHAIAISSPRSLRFRAQNATAIAGRDPKSREKLRLKTVLAPPAMCTGLLMTLSDQ